MKPNNPFLIAGYYSPEFFCDREAETSAILDALHNGRNVTLIAPRRMGKTGLIRHAFYRLQEQKTDIATLYMVISCGCLLIRCWGNWIQHLKKH